ncbi:MULTISPECIES: hypothetical protein [Acidobacteriaceae]|uniref:hypothetical protein n=1 Tax=Acidobacteriaceae TaxID=204434 RepID=UPI00131E379E|nr:MULTISPECIES: hypothetical protein [Acidobacteriaceae]MDW5266913.1 hypothetical protein [Edaphobacter sp.]
MNFTPHLDAADRTRSAIALTKVLLAARNDSEILPQHLNELLRILMWKATQAESSSHRTRFQSQDALKFRDKGNLRHDHVFQCVKMREELLAHPERVDEILETAVGCTVTLAEHEHLHDFDEEYGWKRYHKAGIVVMDTSKQPPRRVDYSN